MAVRNQDSLAWFNCFCFFCTDQVAPGRPEIDVEARSDRFETNDSISEHVSISKAAVAVDVIDVNSPARDDTNGLSSSSYAVTKSIQAGKKDSAKNGLNVEDLALSVNGVYIDVGSTPPDSPIHSEHPLGPLPKAGDIVLGRYKVLKDKPLGVGGWCVVLRAEDLNAGQHCEVALKTYHAQAVRENDDETLARRFANEIARFKMLGLSSSYDVKLDKPVVQVAKGCDKERRATGLFVNLINHSYIGTITRINAEWMAPAKAKDGRYYSVLELADESLDVWLERRYKEKSYINKDELLELTRSLTAALVWMHRLAVCHLDIKPANIMRFGDQWKLIDLEGSLCLTDAIPSKLSLNCFTPMYACPEIAKAVLDSDDILKGSTTYLTCVPSALMDMWSLGVVLLDVLAHHSVFEETWSGFMAASITNMDTSPGLGFHKDWYEWLVDQRSPILPLKFVTSPQTSVDLIVGLPDLQNLLTQLLAKNPEVRMSSEMLVRQPFLSWEILASEIGSSRPSHGSERDRKENGSAKRGIRSKKQMGHGASSADGYESKADGKETPRKNQKWWFGKGAAVATAV